MASLQPTRDTESAHSTTDLYKKSRLTFMYLVNIWSKRDREKNKREKNYSDVHVYSKQDQRFDAAAHFSNFGQKSATPANSPNCPG